MKNHELWKFWADRLPKKTEDIAPINRGITINVGELRTLLKMGTPPEYQFPPKPPVPLKSWHEARAVHDAVRTLDKTREALSRIKATESSNPFVVAARIDLTNEDLKPFSKAIVAEAIKRTEQSIDNQERDLNRMGYQASFRASGVGRATANVATPASVSVGVGATPNTDQRVAGLAGRSDKIRHGVGVCISADPAKKGSDATCASIWQKRRPSDNDGSVKVDVEERSYVITEMTTEQQEVWRGLYETGAPFPASRDTKKAIADTDKS